MSAREPAHVRLVPPQRRRRGVRRRLRHPGPTALRTRPMWLCGVQLIRPIVPPGRVTRTASLRRDLVAGSELDAERREHHVEAAVLERQVLGVALDPVDLDAGGGGALASAVEQLGREVEAGHARAELAARIATLPVPVARSSTSMPGLDRHPLEQVPRRHLVHDALGDAGVAPGGPGLAVGLLELGEPGWARGGDSRTSSCLPPVVCLLAVPCASGPGRAGLPSS